MVRVHVRRVLWVFLVGVGTLLVLASVRVGGAPGERVEAPALLELRAGDTGVGERVSTCDYENYFVPVCGDPGDPCTKCEVSSGGKLVVNGGDGWRMTTLYDCGKVVEGRCNETYACVNTRALDRECRDLQLVEQQPIVGPK